MKKTDVQFYVRTAIILFLTIVVALSIATAVVKLVTNPESAKGAYWGIAE